MLFLTLKSFCYSESNLGPKEEDESDKDEERGNEDPRNLQHFYEEGDTLSSNRDPIKIRFRRIGRGIGRVIRRGKRIVRRVGRIIRGGKRIVDRARRFGRRVIRGGKRIIRGVKRFGRRIFRRRGRRRRRRRSRG